MNLMEHFLIRDLTEKDAEKVLKLCEGNPLYFEYCPPMITKEGVLRDMKALPPGKKPEDKYYLGFFHGEQLTAVLDLIVGYPQDETAFIGLFMMEQIFQNQGIGSQIIEDLCGFLKNAGFKSVQLCWVKGNPQAEHFWLRNHFTAVGERKSNVSDHVISAVRKL